MQIRGSTFIGNAGPIPVYAHWSALLLVALAFLWTPDLSSGLAFLLALVLAVVLHELGHAVVAHVFKLPGIMVVLWGIGGVMLSQRSGPERPGRELAISAAGPAVNYLIAGLALLGLLLAIDLAPASLAAGKLEAMLMDPELEAHALGYLREQVGRLPLEELSAIGLVVQSALWVNLVLAVFNSLPIYPLDGGHIAYSMLRLLRVEVRLARKVCLGLAVIVGGGVIALDAWWRGGTPSVFNLMLVLFLISMSVQWMKAPST